MGGNQWKEEKKENQHKKKGGNEKLNKLVKTGRKWEGNRQI